MRLPGEWGIQKAILGLRATLFSMVALGTTVTKIVLCILFPTKHHTIESEMSSDMNNTYVLTQSSLVYYVFML